MENAEETEKSQNLTDYAAERIAKSILQFQQKIASFLNRKVLRVAPCILKSYLIIFCFLYGMSCFWIILSTVWLPSDDLVKPDHSVNEQIGAPSEMTIDTALTPSVNIKK